MKSEFTLNVCGLFNRVLPVSDTIALYFFKQRI